MSDGSDSIRDFPPTYFQPVKGSEYARIGVGLCQAGSPAGAVTRVAGGVNEGVVRDDRKAAAVDTIVGLGEILRRAAQNHHKPEVTLTEEIEYLHRYIDIQKVRFGERLGYSVDIPEALKDAQVPSLLLQPLVENAIIREACVNQHTRRR